MKLKQSTIDKLTSLYGPQQTPEIARSIEKLLDRYSDLPRSEATGLSQEDIFLITYGDSVRQDNEPGLQTLNRFAQEYLKDIVSIVHILPCFPYSSDDGFSVIDYRRIDAPLGDWTHVHQLATQVDLCFDFVLNHCSSQSDYFKGFLTNDPHYKDFFIAEDPATDTSSVLRPRTSPLLHEFESASGPKYCWTTFSKDQVDLNFQNPNVLLEMLDILLFYVRNGARMLRLDAIAYLWKELGTSCAHLPQTHKVVQLFRDMLDRIAPQVLLLTETNVPHEDNISYFGDGANEAQLVYNFPLPPLLLHTLTAQDATHLTHWAQTIQPVSDKTTFLNFTASHDGIGVRPAADILSAAEFQTLIDLTTRHGGQVSYKNDDQGNPIPYELNINYFDALNNPNDYSLDHDTQIDRFLLSQAIALSLLGLPAIYIHSLFGSRNWTEGVKQTGQGRTINREKLDFPTLQLELKLHTTRSFKTFVRYKQLIKIRKIQKTFHPNAAQEILTINPKIFALKRTAVDQSETLYAIFNVTERHQTIELPCSTCLVNLFNQQTLESDTNNKHMIELAPYQFGWFLCQ